MFYGLGNDDLGVAVSWNDVQIQETVSNRPVRTSLLFFVCDAEKRYGGSEGLAMAHFLPFVQKLNGYFFCFGTIPTVAWSRSIVPIIKMGGFPHPDSDYSVR